MHSLINYEFGGLIEDILRYGGVRVRQKAYNLVHTHPNIVMENIPVLDSEQLGIAYVFHLDIMDDALLEHLLLTKSIDPNVVILNKVLWKWCKSRDQVEILRKHGANIDMS